MTWPGVQAYSVMHASAKDGWDPGARHSAPITKVCPICNAQSGEPCTQPTDNGRRNVTWYHLKREEN